MNLYCKNLMIHFLADLNRKMFKLHSRGNFMCNSITFLLMVLENTVFVYDCSLCKTLI